MVGFINGAQWLVIFMAGATLAAGWFELGMLSSYLFGGVSAVVLAGLIYGMMPRLLLVLFAGVWAYAGDWLLLAMTGMTTEAVAGGIIAGGAGFYANLVWLRQHNLTPSGASGVDDVDPA